MSERARFDADVRVGLDAAVLLARFTRSGYMHKLRYGGYEQRLGSSEIDGLLRFVPHPTWQRRPSPSEFGEQIAFADTLFLGAEVALDPRGERDSRVMRHSAVGDETDCWFRCSLAFFEATEMLVLCG